MSEIIEKETIKQAVKPPSMWNVIFLNDDFTPFDFVILLLTQVFKKSMEESAQITLQIHQNGKGIIAQYSKDVALTKQAITQEYCRRDGHPLMCVIEPT